jgi:hypothetical protein
VYEETGKGNRVQTDFFLIHCSERRYKYHKFDGKLSHQTYV